MGYVNVLELICTLALNPCTALWGWDYYRHSHFTDGKAEPRAVRSLAEGHTASQSQGSALILGVWTLLVPSLLLFPCWGGQGGAAGNGLGSWQLQPYRLPAIDFPVI